MRLAEIREAIRISELTEYGDIINAVVSVPLFRRVRELGIKVVLTGDGSDELFGGYSMYHQVGPDAVRRLFLHKIRHLCRTELQRVDRTSMAFGVEARVPFLDLALVELAMRIPIGPEDARRPGEMDRAGGVRRRAARLHPHPSEEPDVALLRPARAGPALQAAVRPHAAVLRLRPDAIGTPRLQHRAPAATTTSTARSPNTARADYTVAEHARDLLGAMRWNVRAPADPSHCRRPVAKIRR